MELSVHDLREPELDKYLMELRLKVELARKKRKENDDRRVAIERETRAVREDIVRYRAELTALEVTGRAQTIDRFRDCVSHMKAQIAERERLLKEGIKNDGLMQAAIDSKKQEMLNMTTDYDEEKIKKEVQEARETLRKLKEKSTEADDAIAKLKVDIAAATKKNEASKMRYREILKLKAMDLTIAKQKCQQMADDTAKLETDIRLKQATKELLQRETKMMRMKLEKRTRQNLHNLHLNSGK